MGDQLLKHINQTQTNIKKAFAECDKDGDGFLNKSEFHQFVKIGFKKPSCPPGMYQQVCGLFKKDTNVGIDWLSAYSLWKQSNPNQQDSSSSTKSSPKQKTKNKTPPPKQNKSPKANLKRVKTVSTINTNSSRDNARHLGKNMLGKPAPLSPSKSTGRLYPGVIRQKSANAAMNGSALTKENLRHLDNKQQHSAGYDDSDLISNDSASSSYRRMKHIRQKSRGGSVDDQDASQMVVQMMETKLKNLQTSLKLERAKRKKTEELAQSLLQQNEQYKVQISDLQQSTNRMKSENKSFRDQLRKLKNQLDDDRQTIKHLNQQRKAIQIERDETFTLLTKIEKEHSTMIKKEKNKHKQEMEKLSAGFLQSLGAEPGKDVRSVIKELRDNNQSLQDKVDTLAETLSRKQQSLIEALQAVDHISIMEEEKNQFQNIMKPKQPHQQQNGKFARRMSRSLAQMKKSLNNNDNNNDIEIKQLSSLPKPPKRRNSQIGFGNEKPHHRPTATFFKKAVGDNSASSYSQNKINPNDVKSSKEMEFLSQQLTSDVAKKTESIQNLQMANSALVEKMQQMKQQMDSMKPNILKKKKKK
eukprot:452999_1